ncbi:MAG: hypothetical protein KC422_25670 [Trueperaceae bacterium]|nr:hypothetical protein [Trueperaceae bacterium]
MPRSSITFSDELKERIDRYLSEQKVAPSLSTLVQVALETYLDQQELYDRGYRPAKGLLVLSPIDIDTPLS